MLAEPDSLTRRGLTLIAVQVDKVFSNVGFSSAITAASVQHKDITRLKGQTWLNDEIVTFYSQLLNLRAAEAEKARQEGGNDVMSLDEAKQYKTIHAFNSFFWKNVSEKGHASVKRWTRKVGTGRRCVSVERRALMS